MAGIFDFLGKAGPQGYQTGSRGSNDGAAPRVSAVDASSAFPTPPQIAAKALSGGGKPKPPVAKNPATGAIQGPPMPSLPSPAAPLDPLDSSGYARPAGLGVVQPGGSPMPGYTPVVSGASYSGPHAQSPQASPPSLAATVAGAGPGGGLGAQPQIGGIDEITGAQPSLLQTLLWKLANMGTGEYGSDQANPPVVPMRARPYETRR